MKYNLDCIRAVLLALEEKLNIVKIDEDGFDEKAVRISELFELIDSDYSKADIIYSVQKLDEAEYINAAFERGDGLIIPTCSQVFSITYKGHEFLENIRDSETYRKVKKVGKAADSSALSVVMKSQKTWLLVRHKLFLPSTE